MDAHDFELRLMHLRAGVSAGQIRLKDLADIAGALQELNTRIARLVTDLDGPGRSPDSTARIAQLRLTGIREGSTRLAVSFGEPNTLDAGEFGATEDEVSRRFWEIIVGLHRGRRPAWTTPGIAQSTLDLLGAMSRASTGAEITRPDEAPVRFETFDFSKDIWRQMAGDDATERVTVTGLLTAVDLESKRFRIRDDVGNAIPLDDVENHQEAARLVGGRADATGIVRRRISGEIRGLMSAQVRRAEVPAAWTQTARDAGVSVLLDLARAQPGPDPEGVPGLTAEEFARFYAALSE